MAYLIHLSKTNCVQCGEELWLFATCAEDLDNVLHIDCKTKSDKSKEIGNLSEGEKS